MAKIGIANGRKATERQIVAVKKAVEIRAGNRCRNPISIFVLFMSITIDTYRKNNLCGRKS